MAGKKVNRKKLLLLTSLVVVAAAIAAYFLWPDKNSDTVSSNQPQSAASDEPTTQQPTFPNINLQPTVAAWAAKQKGRASVMVYDLTNNKIVASLNPNRQYFTASIY